MSREGALWIGGLEPYMDEEFLAMALQLMGEEGVQSIKVIKNKFTGEPASYGFINFDSDPAALMAMHKLNGKIIPNSQPPVRFKLNHNSTRLMPGEKDHSIWVGDLSPDVDDLQLYKFFSARFQTVKSAKVVLDASGFSKGYGFIRFGDEQEQQTALISMMGISGLGSKPLKISIAVPKPKGDSFGQQGGYHHNQYSSTGSGATGTGSGSGSIADSLPATALAVMVSNASGNPAAGAAVVAEAQQAEYSKYWQQYQQQQQQQYWSHYAAWAQYNQQYNVPPPSGGHPPPGHPQSGYEGYCEAPPVPRDPNASIFEGDELELVDHTEYIDIESCNLHYLGRTEELWDAMTESLWWQKDENEEENPSKEKLLSQPPPAPAPVPAPPSSSAAKS